MLAPIAVFAPLLGFVIVGLFGRTLGDRLSQLITCTLMLGAAACSVMLFGDVVLAGHAHTLPLADWIKVDGFTAAWALRVDQLSVVMMCVINIVSACVHIYSVGYMSHDKAVPKFMAYLSLFTFAMLMLVTADNLLQIFFGWEGVGLASYLLIGFWNEKPSANAAAVKAFIVNRVGDLGLVLGICAMFYVFGTIQFDGIFATASEKTGLTFEFLNMQIHAITLICLLLFVGAVGKSAQLGLHTWLPDAMEGPTPVSALIHAATMVTAGVFLITRFSPLYELAPDALMVVTIVGAATAFVAATIGLTQHDIKRVIAYSTMSQLGYMFFALGVGAYAAAMFHLVTHAFFKALLFLGAGSVIHAMSGEQDMRRMGGIWRKIPFTHAMMVIGSLALGGVPYFAGYYSKDMILESAWASGSEWGQGAYMLGIAAAFMTAFYSWRLMSLTFYGRARADAHTMDHVHESPFVMCLPLVVLAVGAIFSGAYLYGGMVDGYAHHGAPTAHHDTAPTDHAPGLSPTEPQDWTRAAFWQTSLAHNDHDVMVRAHDVPEWVVMLPTAVGLAGMILALVIYLAAPGVPAMCVRIFRPLYHLSFYKWYFDQLYTAVFVRPSFALGRGFWRVGDQMMIDEGGPNMLARAASGVACILSGLQTGYIFHYAFVMMAAVVALVSFVLFKAEFFAVWGF